MNASACRGFQALWVCIASSSDPWEQVMLQGLWQGGNPALVKLGMAQSSTPGCAGCSGTWAGKERVEGTHGLTRRPSAGIRPQVLCCVLSSGCGPSAWTAAGWGDGRAGSGGCAAAAALRELLCPSCTCVVLVSRSPPPGWDGIKRCIVLPSPPPRAQCSDCVV